MAAATLSYPNHQLNDQAWSSESSLITTKSQDSNPDWGQNDPNLFSGSESPKSPTHSIVDSNQQAEETEREDLLFSQEEKNREIREYLKNMPNNDEQDKAHWAYFKTCVGQETQDKVPLAYLNYMKNERILALLQAYHAQEDKYNWNVERQKIKDEQMSHYKQITNLHETLHNGRISNQGEADYFKNKWENYNHGGISADMYRDLQKRQNMLSSQENLELLQQNYSQYNNLVQENHHNGHIHSTSVQDLLEGDGAKFYYNQMGSPLDPKMQKLAQPSGKRIGNKGEWNALDDVMADFQANGHDSTAPSSPHTSRTWGGVTPTPRPSLQAIRHLIAPPGTTPNVPINPLLANPLARSTEAEIIRQLMLMNLGASSAQLQNNQQFYNPQTYGFPLGTFADGQFRPRRRVPMTPTECAFCRNNGEQPMVYRGHILKDAEGRVRCPILRDYTCRNCGATGDMAHTVKYCPLTPKTEFSLTQLQKNLRMANGRRRDSAPFEPPKFFPTTPL